MTRHAAPAITGLLVAWLGTGLLASMPTPGLAFSQLLLWLLCLIVVMIVLRWERLPLASLWLRPPRWQSFAWAAVFMLASTLVILPATEWLRKALGLAGYAQGMEMVLMYPPWVRVLAAITAGIVEETLFRGFAITRLLRLGANAPVTIAVSSAVFAALHLPVWGMGPSLGFFIVSVAGSTFFLWRRDLATMMVAHIGMDLWGLVVSPAMRRWWE
jgi:membrane protease YdiL (CAAX protease family)